MSNDIAMQSASELLKRYQSRQLSPVEVTKAVLAQISAYDRKFNAFCHVDEDAALKAAVESEARWQKGAPKGLLDGVPTAIKDLILTKGWPTSAADPSSQSAMTPRLGLLTRIGS